MLSAPHICPIADVPIASQTVTSVLNHENRFVSFLYNNHTPPPLVPNGKPEQLSIYLYRLLSTTGLVLTVDDEENKCRCVGVAVWQGPITTSTGLLGRLKEFGANCIFDIWNQINWVYYGGSGLNHARMEAYEKVAKQVRLELLGEGNEKNTWYLHMLAVLPEYQGKGIGKALVNYVTDKADKEGLRCYLVTSIFEPNVKIYEKLGFKFVKTAQIEWEGLQPFEFYCMLREPKLK